MTSPGTPRLLFGQIAAAKGYITERQIEDCLREQKESPVELGQILLQRGLITTEQFLDVLLIQDRFVLVCRECNRAYNIFGYQRGDVFPCAHCGKRLEVPATTDEILRERPPATPRPILMNRYRIVREIARGAMGMVFEALDTRLQRVVALKILREGDGEPKAIERFRREAQAVAKLRHPNIIAIHDVGVENGVHFFAMDYVDGGSLDAMILAPGRHVRELVAILEDVARAVDYAHRNGIIHRDLKPQNILLDREGRPVLTDFGLARFEGTSLLLTRAGTAVGTPFYMPPEQVLGEHAKIDARSDVWALGVILYQIVTRELPFDGANHVEIFRKILSDDPPRPQADPDLTTICLRALEKRTSDRYPSALAFAEDLRSWREGRPIRARATGLVTRAFKKVRRNATGVVAVCLAVLLAGVTWFAWRARETQRRAEQSQKFTEVYTTAVHESESLFRTPEGTPVQKVQEEAERVMSLLDRAYELRADPRVRLYRGRLYLFLRRDEEAEREFREAGAEGSKYLARMYLRRYLDLHGHAIVVHHEGVTEVEAPPAESVEARKWRRMAEEEIAHHPGLRRFLDGVIAFGQGEYSAAADALRDFTTAEWLDVEAMELYGRACIFARRLPEALAAFQDAIRVSPSRSTLYRHRAMAHWFLNDLPAAESDYSRVIELVTDDAIAFDLRGTIRYLMRKLPAAVEDFRRAVEIAPDFDASWLHLGQAYLDLDRAAEAEVALTKALPDPHAWSCRGIARLMLGRVAESIADHDESIRLQPRDPLFYVNRGHAKHEAHDLEGAISDYTRAIELDPKARDAWHHRGMVLRERGDLEAAVRDHGEAIRLDPNFADAWGLRAIARTELQQLAPALEDIGKALELDAKNAVFLMQRGLIHSLRGEPEPARRDLDAAIAIAPDLTDAFIHRGNLSWSTLDLGPALADFLEAVRLDPGDARGYNGRGLIHLAMQRTDLAFLDFTRALALDPANPEIRHNRATVWREWGLFDRAVGDLTKALEVQPHPEGYEERARTYREWALRTTPPDRALLQSAIEDFEVALDLLPEDERLAKELEETKKFLK